jgi:hypothetical protein
LAIVDGTAVFASNTSVFASNSLLQLNDKLDTTSNTLAQTILDLSSTNATAEFASNSAVYTYLALQNEHDQYSLWSSNNFSNYLPNAINGTITAASNTAFWASNNMAWTWNAAQNTIHANRLITIGLAGTDLNSNYQLQVGNKGSLGLYGYMAGTIGFGNSLYPGYSNMSGINGKYKGIDHSNATTYGGLGFMVRTQSNLTQWESMTISHDGNVGLSNTNPSYQLQLSKDSAFKPSTNTWSTTSDSRLKEEITNADLAMCYSNVKNIPLKYYKWRDEIYTNDQVKDRHKLGWIAQDVEIVFPKAVEEESMLGYEDCKILNTDQIIATLYGAVQQLQAMVETLQAQIQMQ